MPAAFVARQPIFNHKLSVVGYELLFRGGYIHDAPIADPEKATATVVMNALTELDLGRLVGGKTAWVNVSREFILGGLVAAVPPGVVGFEIVESDLLEPDLVEALRELKAKGYKLSVDHFFNRAESQPHLDLFEIVKLSMLDLGPEELDTQLKRLQSFEGKIVAEKLSTREDHEAAVNAGFEYFQGFFFCKPSVVATRGVSANRLALMQVLAALQNPNIELHEVEALIRHDVALSFRLLRYVNSAYFGLRSEVRSIGQALALLGIENARRWATLSVLATIDDKPTELTLTALTRARFCELAGGRLGIASPAEMFTLGLFSVIDAMMDSPMHDVVESLPFAEDMREALVMHRGSRGILLDTVEAFEHGDDENAQTVVPQGGELYLDAIMWANSTAESLFGGGGGTATATPARTRGRVAAAATSTVPLAVPLNSKPPPPPAPAAPAAPAAVAPDARPGFFARMLGRLFGSRRR